MKKLKLKKKFNIFWSKKIAVYLSQGLHKWLPSYRRSLQLSKENIKHFETQNCLIFFYFCRSFLPSASGSGFRIQIRIDLIQSGSETLLLGMASALPILYTSKETSKSGAGEVICAFTSRSLLQTTFKFNVLTLFTHKFRFQTLTSKGALEASFVLWWKLGRSRSLQF